MHGFILFFLSLSLSLENIKLSSYDMYQSWYDIIFKLFKLVDSLNEGSVGD